MRPQFFQNFVPLHAAQMGAPPVFSGHFEQHFSSDESHVVYPFSFVYPWNAPGVSSFQGGTDIVIEDVVMEDIFSDDMDVDPPKFHPSCAFIFPEPMDVDTSFIYATGEPMDIDTPLAVLELSALFHALTFADPSTIEPDSDSDVDYPHPDNMALILYNPCDKAVVLYNQNKAVVLYTPTDKAVVLYNQNRDPVDVEGPLDTPSMTEESTNPPQETDLPEEYDFDQLIESFRRLVIRDDGPVNTDTKLSSSSVPTAHVPAAVDANTNVPTNGSLQLSSNLECPFANSNIMYICTKCRAHSKGSEYVVEEVSSPTLETGIWIKNISTSTDDRSCSESHATPLSRARRILRMAHPYRRPRSLRTTQTDESNPTSESHSLPQRSTGKSYVVEVISLAKVDASELDDLTIDSSRLRDIPHLSAPDIRAPCIPPEIEKIQIIKDIPRTPHRLYSESHATLPLSQPPQPRKMAHPYRRHRSLRTVEIDESFKKPASELDSLPPSVQHSPKAASIGITKSDVVPGAYPISELERLESLYLNRPPLAMFSPKYWRTVSQWVLELICGW